MYTVKKYDNLYLINKNFILKLDYHYKLFHNDKLDIESIDSFYNNYYKLIERPIINKNLIGYFSTSQQVKYGKTNKGGFLYRVKCLDRKYPDFIVSYNGKTKGKLLIKFKFKNWDNILPEGEIIELLGDYDDINIFTKALLIRYNLNFKLDDFCKKVKENDYEKLITRVNETEFNTFSIDPEGSIDIDDAISINNKNDYNSDIYIYVHIAQPCIYMNIDDFKSIISKRFSTIYGYNNVELLGDKIMKMSSLLKGEIRKCMTIKYDKNLNMIDYYPSIIINKNNYSYDDKIPNIDLLKKICKTDDVHDIVSKLMVITNTNLGKIVNGPYRVIINDKSKYDYDEKYHKLLDVNNYIHFTSPIRRIIDNYYHFLLTYDIKEFLNKDDLEIINYLDKKSKKLNNQFNLDKNINNLEEKVYQAKITNIDYDKSKIEIFIENLGYFKLFVDNINNIINNYTKNIDIDIDIKILDNGFGKNRLLFTLFN
jgi:exoribonuclease R